MPTHLFNILYHLLLPLLWSNIWQKPFKKRGLFCLKGMKGKVTGLLLPMEAASYITEKDRKQESLDRKQASWQSSKENPSVTHLYHPYLLPTRFHSLVRKQYPLRTKCWIACVCGLPFISNWNVLPHGSLMVILNMSRSGSVISFHSRPVIFWGSPLSMAPKVEISKEMRPLFSIYLFLLTWMK